MRIDHDNELVSKSAVEDPTAIDESLQAQLSKRPLHYKLRVQLPIILFAAFIVQFLTTLGISRELLPSKLFLNSVLVAFGANFIALLNFRSMRLFPGTRKFAFIIPAFVPSWTIAIILLLWLRVPYSVPVLMMGGLAAIVSGWLLTSLTRKPRATPFLVVPSKRVLALMSELPKMNFKVCREPAELIGPKSIIADLRADLNSDWEKAIADAVLAGASVYHVTFARESLTGRVRVDHISENSFGMLGTPSLYFAIKSMVDRIAGLVGLILTAPILIFAIMVIRLESRGGAIFKQERVGYLGRPFTIYKLRTMKTADGPETRESAMTQAGDSRITRVGRFLRATRIDELPQFLNMVRGELSLIGPRPEAAILSHWYKENIEFYAYRHVVRPGITGWAQVHQGHVADTASVARKLEYDFYYIKNFSLWLDFVVLLKTAHVVFSSHGAK
ncbi:sugar transferase [Qipengyuania sp. GH1]|uniref:sugar transferase n=1 Tax=Qipengyuania aestuarii TaxID=2867241 RepID=UPI001C883FE9|nr:sugar transferase [Qipengyuania aestuarii]